MPDGSLRSTSRLSGREAVPSFGLLASVSLVLLLAALQVSEAAESGCVAQPATVRAQVPDVPEYSHVRNDVWMESWPDASGQSQSREVRGEIWNEAIAATLAAHNAVHLPKRTQPYYLDGPVVLRSGQKLTADADAEIRLRPGCSTCMVRNERLVGFAEAPVPGDLQPDTDIVIEGGIWTTLANGAKDANGNPRGSSSKQQPVAGTHGVILLHNVRRVTVRNVTVRQSRAFAVHLGNVREFVVDGVTLDRHGRDGVHVNGPASEGVIRNVRGDSHDDPVALNAWEWKGYAPSYGPIHHILIERITGALPDKNATDSIRLLPGVKRFADGTTLDCPIHDIVIRDITDITEFKFYDQPNLEAGRDNDFSIALGKLSTISLQRLTFTRPGVIKVAADVDGLSVDEVDLRFTPSPGFKLIEIGPMSQTYRFGADSSKWVEIFSPDRDVTVRGFRLGTISINGQPAADAEARFLSVKDQCLNPDYPKTAPRGGTGKATLVR